MATGHGQPDAMVLTPSSAAWCLHLPRLAGPVQLLRHMPACCMPARRLRGKCTAHHQRTHLLRLTRPGLRPRPRRLQEHPARLLPGLPGHLLRLLLLLHAARRCGGAAGPRHAHLVLRGPGQQRAVVRPGWWPAMRAARAVCSREPSYCGQMFQNSRSSIPPALTRCVARPPCVQSMLLAIGTCTMNWLFTAFTR